MSTKRIHKLFKKARGCFSATMEEMAIYVMIVITFPYYLLFWRYTHKPIMNLFSESTSDRDVRDMVRIWLDQRKRESLFIQAAGAITFASTISALSWSSVTVAGTHWVVLASWYSSILLGLAAVVSGAQQAILIETESGSAVTPDVSLRCDKREFWGCKSPRTGAIFAWQAPLMFLNYAIFFFLVGLSMHIIYPVVKSGQFDDNAKILTMFGTVCIICASVFITCSRVVHNTLTLTSGDEAV